jgi:NADH dehydrogenase FAD-containing subunit
MKKIVIIGAGVAGLMLLARLTNQSSTLFNIIVVEKKNYFESGIFSLRMMVEPGEFDSTHVMLEDIQKRYNRKGHVVQIMTHTQAESLNCDKKQVTIKKFEDQSSQLDYDYLVLANGSLYNTPYVKPDINTFSHPDMRRLEFQSFQKQVLDPENTHVVIVGGGALGLELVGELVDVNSTRENPYKITLVHSRSILRDRSNSQFIHNYIMNFMKRNNVDVILGHRVNISNDHNNTLDDVIPSIKKTIKIVPSIHCTDTSATQKTIEDVSMIFWCSSLKPCTSWLEESNIELDEQGYVKVDQYLQCENNSNVFAIGDVNNAPGEKLAGVANYQSLIVASNIIRVAKQSSPNWKFYSWLASVNALSLSLGSTDAFMSIGGWIIVWGRVAAYFKTYSGRKTLISRVMGS